MQKQCMKSKRKVKIFLNDGFVEEEIKFEISQDVNDFYQPDFLIVPPPFDTHIHGGWDIDVMSEPNRFLELEEKLISSGIFFAIPTLMNHELERIKEIAQEFTEYKKKKKDSIFPFLRIEGPFISYEKSGAQSKKHILEVNRKNLDKFFSLYPAVKMFTFAPEINGAETLAEESLKLGMIPSVGHTNGRFNDFLKVYKLGVRHFTHFGNAMRGLHQREIGILGAGFYFDDVYLEFIGDLIHLNKQFVELLLKLKNKKNLFLISDMIPPAKGSISSFGGNKIIRRGNILITQDGAIAGGSMSVKDQIKKLKKYKFDFNKLIYVSSFLSHKNFFKDYFNVDYPSKDFLVVDKEFNIKAIFKKGKRIL